VYQGEGTAKVYPKTNILWNYYAT